MGMSQKRLCMLSSGVSVSVCFSAVAVSQDGNVTEAAVCVVRCWCPAAGVGRHHDSRCGRGGQGPDQGGS